MIVSATAVPDSVTPLTALSALNTSILVIFEWALRLKSLVTIRVSTSAPPSMMLEAWYIIRSLPAPALIVSVPPPP